MDISLFSPAKNYNKVLLIAGGIVLFFFCYNRFLIDRSFVNLKITLEQLSQIETPADLKRIKPLLKTVLLKELAKISSSSISLGYIETALQVIDAAQTPEEIAEVKFLVSSVVEALENNMNPVQAAFGDLNKYFVPPQTAESKQSLRKLIQSLHKKIDTVKGTTAPATLQQWCCDLGNAYLRAQSFAQAKEYFLKAIALDPQSPAGIKSKFNVAWICKEEGDFEKAMQLFTEVAQTGTRGDAPAMGMYQCIDVLLKKGEFQDAVKMYNRFAEEYPEFSIADLAMYEAAYISFYTLHQNDAALGYLEKLEEKFPRSKLIRHSMAMLRPAIAGSFMQSGYQLLLEKRYIDAQEKFDKGLSYDPLNGPCRAGLGLVYYWYQQQDVAIQEASQAVDSAPADELTLINAMFTLINSEKIDKAIAIGEEAMHRFPIKRPEFYYNLAYAYIRKQDIDNARKNLSKSLRIDPELTYAYNNLGCAFWSAKNYKMAINKFREAVARTPGFVEGHFNLGVASYQMKQYRAAYDELQLVLKIKPDYKDAQALLDKVVKEMNYVP